MNTIEEIIDIFSTMKEEKYIFPYNFALKRYVSRSLTLTYQAIPSTRILLSGLAQYIINHYPELNCVYQDHLDRDVRVTYREDENYKHSVCIKPTCCVAHTVSYKNNGGDNLKTVDCEQKMEDKKIQIIDMISSYIEYSDESCDKFEEMFSDLIGSYEN
jgi:hypothetical protein